MNGGMKEGRVLAVALINAEYIGAWHTWRVGCFRQGRGWHTWRVGCFRQRRGWQDLVRSSQITLEGRTKWIRIDPYMVQIHCYLIVQLFIAFFKDKG